MVDLKVGLAAMRSDAGVWDRAGNDLTPPRQAVDSLNLTAADVSMYGSDRGIDSTYREVQEQIRDMLRQAAENFHNISGALRQSANEYERNEQDNVHGLNRAAGSN